MTSFLLRRTLAVRGLLALLMLQVLVAMAHAAELKVFSGNGMRAILDNLTEDFERTTGHKLQFTYATAGLMRDRIRAGEIADVAVMQRYLLDELLERGKIVRASIVDLARSPIGLLCASADGNPTLVQLRRSNMRCWRPNRLPTPIRPMEGSREPSLRVCLNSWASLSR